MDSKIIPYLTKPYRFIKILPMDVQLICYTELGLNSGFPIRASGGFLENTKIYLDYTSDCHFKFDEYEYVIGCAHISEKEDFWMCVMQILAYTFHDYAVRETICNKNIFNKSPEILKNIQVI